MATRDRMDLDVRSQAFLKDFYHFHKNSCDAWYIKDANHHFIDTSITFLSRFLPPELTSVIGLCDDDVSEASVRDIALMHEFESLVMSQNKEVTILACNYFTDLHDIKSFILQMKPWHYSDGAGVIIYVSDLVEVNKKINWLSVFIGGSSDDYNNAVLSDFPRQEPLMYVTNKEWEAVWLVICGCSTNQIADFMNISSRGVEYKLSSAYIKLKVFNKSNLLYLAERFRWIELIPDRFVSASNVLIIS